MKEKAPLGFFETPAGRRIVENAVEMLNPYRAIEAKDGEEALRIMATSEAGIDLLLSDVIMPEKSGPELVKQAAEGHPKTRSLFMSGYSADMVKLHGLLMQGDSFLEKPFTKRSLLMKVYSALRRESERHCDN